MEKQHFFSEKLVISEKLVMGVQAAPTTAFLSITPFCAVYFQTLFVR